MKEAHFDRIKKAGVADHGCYRGGDGDCYYLCSMVNVDDFGEKHGRIFNAYVENEGGKLQLAATLHFAITASALATARVQRLIGDEENYVTRAGLARLKAMLDRGIERGTKQDISLTSQSTDSEFAIPRTVNPIFAQQRLRQEILCELAILHSEGHKEIPFPLLVERLCTEMEWVHRALRILAKKNFVKQIAEGNLVLTDEGHLEAETALSSISDKKVPQVAQQVTAAAPASAAKGPKPFDCFVCYAGEDRPMVRELVKALTDQDIQVWWDKGQITIGDRLSQKIEQGLSLSRYGLVIVSKFFVAKKWTEAELRALANRSISSGQKVILPVLVGMTHEEFAATYPLLSDIVSTTFNGDYAVLVDEIARAIG